jgi:hypothetical protein
VTSQALGKDDDESYFRVSNESKTENSILQKKWEDQQELGATEENRARVAERKGQVDFLASTNPA